MAQIQLTRRSFLIGAGATGLALALPATAYARPPLKVLVATNEPWGTYHSTALLPTANSGGDLLRHVVPDMSQIKPGDPVTSLTLAQAKACGADVLVVNGATDWPADVVKSLPGLPVVASSLAYLRPIEEKRAAEIRPRLVAMTAASQREAEVFAAHFGVDPHRVRVVGNPQLDQLPPRQPVPGSVLILTSVTKSSATGASAPGTQLLLQVAAALAAEGKHIRVGLHPREDPALWAAYEIAPEGSIPASAKAEVALGIPGSVFPPIAAVGTPLVSIVDPALEVPQYLLDIATEAATVSEALAAVEQKWVPDRRTLREVVGPIGDAGRKLWQVWFAASRRRMGRAA